VANEKEDIQGAEGQGLDDEQVGGPDAAQLVRQERSPALAFRQRWLSAGLGFRQR
jgi:hypothetical protein